MEHCLQFNRDHSFKREVASTQCKNLYRLIMLARKKGLVGYQKGRLMVSIYLQVKNGAMILVALGLVLFSVSVVTASGEKVSHPELSEQEQLIDCAECHKSTTPEIEKEWYDSVHGIAMVKCYQCHGTFGEFVVTPSKDNCAVCHADMLDKEPNTPCWECHVPHSFKAKK